MVQKILQAVLIAIPVGGLVMLAFGLWIAGGIVTVVGLVLLYLWWRFYQIMRIAELLSKEDYEGAKAQLAKIKNPEKLNDYSKTYYYYYKGMISVKENKFKEAETECKRALEVNRFRSPDEKAMTHFLIGQLLLRKRNREGGRRHLVEARSLTDNKEIKEQIRILAKQARIRM